MRIRSSLAAVVLAGVGAALVLPVSPAAAQERTTRTTTVATATPYYIEFRAASIGTYGHSYVVYGRLNARGEPADFHYTDRHPVGNYALMAIGHVVPVPANSKWNAEVLKLKVSSTYRHRLTAAQYQSLVREVRAAQAEKAPTWNAIANNCNHYAARLARAAGLKAPTDLQLSYGFVPSLRALNTASPGPATRGRPTAPRASSPRT